MTAEVRYDGQAVQVAYDMKTWIAVVLSLLFWHVSTLAVPNDGGSLTAYLGATLIDGTGRAPQPDAVVLVAGERIAAAGSRNEVRIPKEARAVDAKGKWIMPGLIDAHVHFFQSGGLYTRPDVIDLRGIRPYAKEIAWIKQRLPKTFARYERGHLGSRPWWATLELRGTGPRRADADRATGGRSRPAPLHVRAL